MEKLYHLFADADCIVCDGKGTIYVKKYRSGNDFFQSCPICFGKIPPNSLENHILVDNTET